MQINNKILSFQSGVHCLEQGELIIYPTETFFAVGCKVHSLKSLAALYAAKKRPQVRPIPVLAAHMQQVQTVATLNTWEEKIAEQFWPGPLTIIASVRASVPKLVVAGGDKIAIRISSHPVALALAQSANDALICSSANISGEPPATDYKQLSPGLTEKVQGIVLDEPCPRGGLASTIIEVLGANKLIVKRRGAVSNEQLQDVGWDIVI